MLTQEQRAIRATGIGASESAALLGLSPYKTALDVWMLKVGLIQPDESPQAEVGSILEAGLLEVYRRRTGRRVVQTHETLRHPTHTHVLASPDGLLVDDDRGVEIKLVGARVAHHWEADSVPDYVAIQCAQNMLVTGRATWDVIALVGGTDFRVATLTRATELEEALVEACETFWVEYVERREPPPVEDPDARRRYLRARYPGSDRTKCVQIEGREIRDIIADLTETKRALDDLERAKKALEADVLEMIGDEYGVESPWGKFIAPSMAGRVDYRAIAEELTGGAIPADLIEKHRGAGHRQLRFYPPKEARS